MGPEEARGQGAPNPGGHGVVGTDKPQAPIWVIQAIRTGGRLGPGLLQSEPGQVRRQRTAHGGERPREAAGGMKPCGALGRAGREPQLLRVSPTDAQPRGACDLPRLPAPWPWFPWDTGGPQTGASHPLLSQQGDSVEPWDGEAGGSLTLLSLPHGVQAAGWGQMLTCRTGVSRRWAGTHGPQPSGFGGWGARRYC